MSRSILKVVPNGKQIIDKGTISSQKEEKQKWIFEVKMKKKGEIQDV